jgi:hypothetical protein
MALAVGAGITTPAAGGGGAAVAAGAEALLTASSSGRSWPLRFETKEMRVHSLE